MPKPAKNGFLSWATLPWLTWSLFAVVAVAVSRAQHQITTLCADKGTAKPIRVVASCLESRRANKWKASRHCPCLLLRLLQLLLLLLLHPIFAAWAFDFCGSTAAAALHSSRSIICYGIPSVCLLIPHVNQVPNYSLNAKDNWPFWTRDTRSRQKDINFNMESDRNRVIL